MFKRKYKADKKYVSPSVRRYRFRTGLVAIICLLGGGYLLLLTLAPKYPTLAGAGSLVTPTVGASEAVSEDKGNRLIIEKLGLNLRYGPREADLSEGAWHRYAERSDPEKGGNMVLAGHRFELGWTPQQTKARSPFYKLDTMQPGDKVQVKFNEKIYDYEVIKKYHVEGSDVWVENDSEEHKLTIYSCELGGSDKGRIVIEAVPSN